MGNESWTKYKTWFAELKNNQMVDLASLEHELTYGIQYQNNNQNTMIKDLSALKKSDRNFGYYQPYYMPSGTQQVMAAFIQDDISWRNFVFSPALRYDYVRNQGVKNLASRYNNPKLGHDYSAKSYNGLSYKLAMYYQVSDRTSLFANYSYGFRAPSIRELYSVGTGNASASSQGLKPEKVFATRLGVMTSFNNLLAQGDELQFRPALFNTMVKDNINRRLGMYYEKRINSKGELENLPGQEQYTNLRGYSIRGA